MKRLFRVAVLMLLIYSPAGKVYIFDDSNGIKVVPSTTGGFMVLDSDSKTIGYFSQGWGWTVSTFKPVGEENWQVDKTIKVGK